MNMLTMALCYIDPLLNECSVDLTDNIWLGFFQTCNIKAPCYFVSSKKVFILALDLSGLLVCCFGSQFFVYLQNISNRKSS